jgi:uncharacterized membrane protein YphA (DoxX/SURF4 family)
MSSLAALGLLRMTTAAAPLTRRRSLTIATWVGRAFLALAFVGAGASTLAGDPVMVTMFDLIGAGQGLRYVVGALEVAGAIGVLVPRLSALAAAGLALLMIGATITNLTVLDAAPWSPLVLLVVAGFVAWAGRRRVVDRALPSKT